MPYNTIYSLDLVKLKTFKTYIKINLTNNFIQLFKSFIEVFIFFVKKFDNNFYLYKSYYSLNNLVLKN